MSQAYLIVLTISLLVVAVAMTRGGHPEKWCAAIIAGEVTIDLLILLTMGPRSFGESHISRILLDGIAAALLVAVAMRANRIYPLAIAAAQLVALIGNVVAMLAVDGMAQAFWAMTQMPLFLQLALLAGGTLAHRLRLAKIGEYNCWSPKEGPQRQFG